MASGEGSIDPYGFLRPDDFDYDTYNDFVAGYLGVLAHRKQRWERELRPQSSSSSSSSAGPSASTVRIKRNAKWKRFIRKGIPNEHRRLMWLATSGAQSMLVQNPGLFHSLLKRKEDDTLGQNIEVIKIDIPRTFPENVHFRHANEGLLPSLYNVLVAFVHHHPEIGYCQGLNYITGVLLLVVRDEESAFWLLTVLIERILPDYYSSGMRGLLVDTDVLTELIRARNPHLHEHLERIGVAKSWPIVFTKWLICLFVDVLPFETVLRIWDCIFYEGSKVILRTGLTVVLDNAAQLMACTDIGQVMSHLKSYARDSATTVDCHRFTKTIFKTPGSLPSKEIDRLREKYARLHQERREHST